MKHERLTRREFIQHASVTAAALAGCARGVSLNATSDTPANVVFVLADQMRFSAISVSA